jgi:hypothetical protein
MLKLGQRYDGLPDILDGKSDGIADMALLLAAFIATTFRVDPFR